MTNDPLTEAVLLEPGSPIGKEMGKTSGQWLGYRRIHAFLLMFGFWALGVTMALIMTRELSPNSPKEEARSRPVRSFDSEDPTSDSPTPLLDRCRKSKDRLQQQLEAWKAERATDQEACQQAINATRGDFAKNITELEQSLSAAQVETGSCSDARKSDQEAHKAAIDSMRDQLSEKERLLDQFKGSQFNDVWPLARLLEKSRFITELWSGLNPNRWTVFDNFQYLQFNYLASFTEAELTCNLLGSHLASIDRIGVNTFVKNMATGWPWIGLRRLPLADDWQWTDGAGFTFRNFAPGEPGNTLGPAQLIGVAIDNEEGKWHPIEPGNVRRFICKKRRT